MSTITPAQIDLTEHVFRSVRGWLHRLFPADQILVERRTDEALTPSDAAAGASTPDRPLWHLAVTAGPTWDEHTGYSAMHLLTIDALRACTGIWDAQRVAGKVLANATRPAGRIPLRAYNLAFPQPPDVSVSATPATLPALVDVAVAAVDAQGVPVTAPSEPLTLSPGTQGIDVHPANWPAGAGLATTWHIYAGEPGEALTRQASIPAGASFTLTALAEGTTTPTNLSAPLLGLRVNAVDATPAQLSTEGDPAWNMRATLRLAVQVPSVRPVHLDDALLP